jgi:hypothetical protein
MRKPAVFAGALHGAKAIQTALKNNTACRLKDALLSFFSVLLRFQNYNTQN